MVIVFFTSIDPKGSFEECSYGGPDIESCFDTLNDLTAAGWKLIGAQLVEHPGKSALDLPVEAFTGESMTYQLEQLQKTWEAILAHPRCYFQTRQQSIIRQHQQRTTSIRHAFQLQESANQRREKTHRRIENLFDKMDTIQVRIQEIKTNWGVV